MSENKQQANRPKRVPLGARNRLTFNNLQKGYKYRVINDVDDRISKALEAGYDFVESDEKLGEKRAAEGTVPGAAVKKPVGGGMTGYLMRIREDWYNEDQKEKHKQVDALEASTLPNTKDIPKDEQYGSGLTKE